MILCNSLVFDDQDSSLQGTFEETSISKIFPDKVNHLVYIKGLIKKVQVKTFFPFSCYYCDRCGTSSTVVQELTQIREPPFCPNRKCGRTRWSLDMNLSDTTKGIIYTIVPEGGAYEEKIYVYSTLKNYLNPGSRYEGIVYPRTHFSHSKKTTVEYCISIHEVSKENTIEENFIDLPTVNFYLKNLNSDQTENLPELTNIFRDFKGSYLEGIKEAILYQIVSTSFFKKNSSSRDTLNVLLVGRPGTGKSSILKRVSKLCGTIMVNGSASTSAGIIAACVKSEKEEGYTLEAGSCLMADRNVLCIDELDKSKSKSIIEELHEPMEQGTVSFNKAGLHLVLNSRVAFLIAMNPEKNAGAEADSVFKTRYLTNSFLNRIDLLFYIKEGNLSETDSLEMITNSDREPSDDEILEWKRKVSIIKSHPDPTIPLSVGVIIYDYYKMLEANKKNHFRENQINQERFLITIRQREALERLAKCIAKIRLNLEVTVRDATDAIKLSSLSIYSLFSKSENEEQGSEKIDISRKPVETKEEKISRIKKFLVVPLTINELVEKTNCSQLELEQILQRLMKIGVIYSPKIGYYERIDAY